MRASRVLSLILTKSNPRRAARPTMVRAKTCWRVGRLNPRILARRLFSITDLDAHHANGVASSSTKRRTIACGAAACLLGDERVCGRGLLGFPWNALILDHLLAVSGWLCSALSRWACASRPASQTFSIEFTKVQPADKGGPDTRASVGQAESVIRRRAARTSVPGSTACTQSRDQGGAR